MPDFGRLFSTLYRWGGILTLRFYGAVFAALGLLFLYWGAHGLLAYSSGVRAAWTEPAICLLGLASGPLIAWFGWRMLRDSQRHSTPLFSQSILLTLALLALGGAVLILAEMGSA